MIRNILVRLRKKYKKNREENIYKKKVENVKGQLGKCGEGLEVFGDVELAYPDRIFVGDGCKLNHQVYMNGRSSIILGDDVTISYGAKIVSTGYDLDVWIKKGRKNHFEDKKIIIGNHCWIGVGATILPGVKITGEYVVIAAGAVVTKDIEESYVVLAGIPAKVVKRLEV